MIPQRYPLREKALDLCADIIVAGIFLGPWLLLPLAFAVVALVWSIA